MRTQQGTDSVSLLYAKQILMEKQITIDTQFSERAEGSFPDGRSRIKYLRHENNLTNRFHVAVRLFSNRSQMTSKCGKNKKVAHEAIAECVTDVLTTF